MHYRRLSLSIFLTSIVEIFNKIYPLVIVRLVIDRIGYEAFGFAQFGITLVEISVPLITFGYHNYASIAVGQNGVSSREISEIFSSTLVLKLIHAAILAVLLCGSLAAVPSFADYRWLLIALNFTMIGNVLDSSWMNIGLQKISLMATIIIVSKILSLLAIVLLVKDHSDAILYAVLHCLANTVVNFATFYTFVKKYPLQLKVSTKKLKLGFNKALPFAVMAIFHILFLRLDFLVVQDLMGDIGTGFYAGPVRINNAVYSFLAAVGTVFFSESIRCKDIDERQRHYRLGLFFMSFLVAPFILLAWNFDQEILSLILGVLSPQQNGVLSILALGSIGSVGINLFGLQILGTLGQIRKMVQALLVGLLISAALLYFWGYLSEQASLVDIALAMVIGKVFATVLLAIYSRPYLKKLLYPSVFKIIGITAVMAALRRFGYLDLYGVPVLIEIFVLCVIYVAAVGLFNYLELRLIFRALFERK